MKVTRRTRLIATALAACVLAIVVSLVLVNRTSPLQQCENGIKAEVASGQVLAGNTTRIPACASLSPAQKKQAYDWGLNYVVKYYTTSDVQSANQPPITAGYPAFTASLDEYLLP